MVRSFALVYTEMAFERATPQERLAAVRYVIPHSFQSGFASNALA